MRDADIVIAAKTAYEYWVSLFDEEDVTIRSWDDLPVVIKWEWMRVAYLTLSAVEESHK